MSQSIRVHLRIPGTAPMPELVRLIQDVEAAGFDGAGILDSQLLSRDAFVVLGQAASNTSRLTLFPAVTNPFTRDASVLASAIQTVEELAPGRVKFMIGTGYTSASTIGRKPATLAEMRACIATVKGLLAGQTVDFDGTPGRLGYASGRRHSGDHGGLGAQGDRARGGDRRRRAPAGRIQPRHHRACPRPSRARRQARGPAARRPRDHLGSTDLHCRHDRRRLAVYARPTAVHWGVLRWGGYWLEPAGLQLPKLEVPEAVHRIYPDLSHAHDWEAAIAATAFVPDDVAAQLCDAIGLIGTPDDCANRIPRWRSSARAISISCRWRPSRRRRRRSRHSATSCSRGCGRRLRSASRTTAASNVSALR